MSIKITVIGAEPGRAATPSPATPPAHAGLAPTVLGSPAAPAALKPTSLPSAPLPEEPVPTAPATDLARSIRASVIADAPAAPVRHVDLSSLPGERRVGLDVSLEELRLMFPGHQIDALERARAVLKGLHPKSMDTVAWLEFGQEHQQKLAELVRERLKQNQDPQARTVSQHLRRLNEILSQVLAAFHAGMFRKTPAAVWTEHEQEVQQLERLLADSDSAMAQQLRAYELLQQPAAECGHQLEAAAIAAEYLGGHVPSGVEDLLLARQASLTASHATQVEHALLLAQDIKNSGDLITLVKDGVLVKLPSLYTQLATVAGKLSDTQRFIVAEALKDLIQTLDKTIK